MTYGYQNGIETGGEYFYIVTRNGNHALLQAVESEDEPDIEIATGHYTWCNQLLNKIIEKNVDYDHNL